MSIYTGFSLVKNNTQSPGPFPNTRNSSKCPTAIISKVIFSENDVHVNSNNHQEHHHFFKIKVIFTAHPPSVPPILHTEGEDMKVTDSAKNADCKSSGRYNYRNCSLAELIFISAALTLHEDLAATPPPTLHPAPRKGLF